jgi:hypothetical protein
MEIELNGFIDGFYNGKFDYEQLSKAPRNFNWHYKGNLGPALHRQRQVDDLVNEEIGKNNDWKSIGLSTLEQNQIRKYGLSRKIIKQRGYTDKVERVQNANQSYLDRLNILQPGGSEKPLRGQVDEKGEAIQQGKFNYEQLL